MSTIESRDAVSQQPKTNEETFNQNFNKFNINYLKYPLDLGENEFKHWISFGINVRGKSTLSLPNETRLGGVARDPDAPQLSDDALATAGDFGIVAASTVAGATLGGIVGKTIGSFIDKRDQITGGNAATFLKGLGAVGGGITGALAGVVLTENQYLKADTSFKISDVINLYVDGPPTVKYNTQYSNKDLGTVAGLAGLPDTDAVKNEALPALAVKFAQLPQIIGVNTADIIGASAKVALNPFKEVLFEAIDFRAFNFKYKFMPKSEQEAMAVFNIIEKFKFHMHPELSANKLFYIYPSEFQITYHFKNKQNNKTDKGYFHKFKPCVLESMDVVYGGDQFSSFVDGKPTEINVSLTFRETEILTKQQIRDGY